MAKHLKRIIDEKPLSWQAYGIIKRNLEVSPKYKSCPTVTVFRVVNHSHDLVRWLGEVKKSDLSHFRFPTGDFHCPHSTRNQRTREPGWCSHRYYFAGAQHKTEKSGEQIWVGKWYITSTLPLASDPPISICNTPSSGTIYTSWLYFSS